MANKINAVIVTVSDTRLETTDTSGDTLRSLLEEFGTNVVEKIIVSDDLSNLTETLFALTEREEVNLILTTGGTGFAERDNTPEATKSIIEKETPGISEALRAESAKHTKFAMLSRGVSGIRNKTLIINFPGSTKGVEQCFDVVKNILSHAINLIEGETDH